MSDQKIRVIFLGSDDFSLPSLQALDQDPRFEVPLVISQPDKRRKRKVLPTPVKAYALDHGLNQITPDRINSPEVLQQMQEQGADFLVVVAYGQLIGRHLLAAYPDRIVNIHGSLLPAYRGAAPIQRALLAGEKETGDTAMLISQGLDVGDILAQVRTPIKAEDDLHSLSSRLAQLGGELLLPTLLDFDALYAQRQAQDSKQATYAEKISKDEGWLDFTDSAIHLLRQIQTFKDWPGARFQLAGQLYKIHGAQALAEKEKTREAEQPAPGQVLSVDRGGIRIQTGEGILLVEKIQAPGKRVMSVSDFLNGHDFPLERIDENH